MKVRSNLSNSHSSERPLSPYSDHVLHTCTALGSQMFAKAWRVAFPSSRWTCTQPDSKLGSRIKTSGGREKTSGCNSLLCSPASPWENGHRQIFSLPQPVHRIAKRQISSKRRKLTFIEYFLHARLLTYPDPCLQASHQGVLLSPFYRGKQRLCC